MLAASVSGFAAVVLAGVLDATLPERLARLNRLVEMGRLPPHKITEVRRAHAAIRLAAQQWSDAAADDNTAEQVTAAPRDSIPSEIDTTTAADLLRVTPNRVRQLVRSGQINGRRIGRAWLVDRKDVELRGMAAGEQ